MNTDSYNEPTRAEDSPGYGAALMEAVNRPPRATSGYGRRPGPSPPAIPGRAKCVVILRQNRSYHS